MDDLDFEGLSALRDYIQKYGYKDGIENFRQTGYDVWDLATHTMTKEEWKIEVDQKTAWLVANLNTN